MGHVMIRPRETRCWRSGLSFKALCIRSVTNVNRVGEITSPWGIRRSGCLLVGVWGFLPLGSLCVP